MYHHILRLFSRNAFAYDHYDAVKHKCRIVACPVFINPVMCAHALMCAVVVGLFYIAFAA